MNSKFFHFDNLERIGVCKQLFENFAFRTIAYNLEHVVSLIFFNHKIDHVLDFTESINDFNFSVSIAKPEGSTKLYDTILYAVKLLV